ncbi:MAG: V-type ATP synthase subunit A [Clostridia bacterium]|nr:V-type ATP synthase subunit A [Clostridia bacterium]
MEKTYQIYSINGPVITIKGKTDLSMMEMVFVGKDKLAGEVILIDNEKTTIQVYEETAGLSAGEPIYPSGSPLTITLGPGLMSNIFDGIERPLSVIKEQSGAFIKKGSLIPSLDAQKKWDVTLLVKEGDALEGGAVYASCPETSAIIHYCLLAPDLSGEVVEVKPDGQYTVNDTVLKLKDSFGTVHDITLCQKWPIRTPRPVKERMSSDKPLLTGQRILDTLFPVAKGGAAAIPGGFGTGKTMTQHQLAKWCDADIIIYVGCGERGNEMTQVLQEFSELIDPKTGKPMTERTILIANTSNMPVAAREASIYTGVTLAEYYRDMGYHTAMMADSSSRWAEALREISGRLEEMPADEGFPAYLPSRLSEFYERAGYMKTLCQKEGSITLIGAVSPQGGDFSEPVTQNTKRFTRCFWALDKSLAYARHYPAINWTTSYSEYLNSLAPWYSENLSPKFMRHRERIASLLQQEADLMEIVKLIGSDVLPDDQKLIIEIARVIRVGFLQQNAFHEIDTYVPLEKQYQMMRIILYLYKQCSLIVAQQIPISQIKALGLFDKAIQLKYIIPNDDLSGIEDFKEEIDAALTKFNIASGGKLG